MKCFWDVLNINEWAQSKFKTLGSSCFLNCIGRAKTVWPKWTNTCKAGHHCYLLLWACGLSPCLALANNWKGTAALLLLTGFHCSSSLCSKSYVFHLRPPCMPTHTVLRALRCFKWPCRMVWVVMACRHLGEHKTQDWPGHQVSTPPLPLCCKISYWELCIWDQH